MYKLFELLKSPIKAKISGQIHTPIYLKWQTSFCLESLAIETNKFISVSDFYKIRLQVRNGAKLTTSRGAEYMKRVVPMVAINSKPNFCGIWDKMWHLTHHSWRE